MWKGVGLLLKLLTRSRSRGRGRGEGGRGARPGRAGRRVSLAVRSGRPGTGPGGAGTMRGTPNLSRSRG